MLLNTRGTASIVFLVMMHARLRGWGSVCDNTAAVMLGVGKGTYASCSQSRAGVIFRPVFPPPSSWPAASQLAPVPACRPMCAMLCG